MRAALLAMIAAGCGSESAVTRVELGTGADVFAPLAASGGDVELVHGPQGGWHVGVATRVWTSDPDGPADMPLVYTARRPGSPVLGTTSLVLDASLFLREGDHWLRLGDRVIIDVTGPTDVVGATLDLTVDADGVAETRAVRVVDALP